MSSPLFRWLHFSDLHVGLSVGRRLWPSFKTKFLDDLSVQHTKSGPWDAVLFTGDLTQKGSRDEYDELDSMLDEIWARFAELGCNPTLVTIPGNHDLTRPGKLESHALALENYWQMPPLQEGLFEPGANEYLAFLDKVFGEYLAWRERLITSGRHATPTIKGLMPGDAAYRLTVDDRAVGIVGLNSTWLQLGAGNYKEKLAVDVRQLLAVTGDDPDKWCRDNAANMLLTHHPLDWLHDQSKKSWPGDIDTNMRFDLHLFGHMHDHDTQSHSHGGGPTRRSAQASSLFGLEKYDDGREDRAQGYSLNQLSDGPEYRALKVWPRILTQQKDNDWKLAADQSQGLIDDQYYIVPYIAGSRMTGIVPEGQGASPLLVTLASKPEAMTAELEKVRHYIADEPAHAHVRTIELSNAEQALRDHRIVWAVSDWGMGDDGFLGALQANMGDAGIPTYRFDLADYQDREQFLADTQVHFGVAFEVLAANIATVGRSYILLHNIPVDREASSGVPPIEVDIEGLAELLTEFAPSSRVVLRAGRPPRRTPRFPVVELKALDEPDVTVYLREHPQGGDTLAKPDTVGALYRHTDGVPSRIDIALRELAVSSLETVVKANTDLGDRAVTAAIPPALIGTVAAVEQAQKEGSNNAFELLKALACLPRGDQLERIERLHGPKPFRSADALMLTERGLVESVLPGGLGAQEDRTGAKMLMVSRPVREYVRGQLTEAQAQSLDRKMIELYFGGKWKSAKISSSRAARNASSSLCDMHGVANSCMLIVRHIILAVKKKNGVEIDAGIRLASAFVECLKKGSHHRAAAELCADVLQAIPTEGYDRERAILLYERAGSLRMTKARAEARDIILELDFEELSKHQRQLAKLDLALAYQSLDADAEAAAAAKECIALDGRSGAALQAKSILIEQDNDKERRRTELGKLRKRSSRMEAFRNANNIAITMSREARRDGNMEEALSLLRDVLENARQHKDFYNGARAIADIAGMQPAGVPLAPADKLRLIDAYHFAHNERQSALFDQCHSGLWKAFEAEGDIENLLRLYRSSSFIWRLHGEDAPERKYLDKLRSLKGRMALASRDRDYFFIRVVIIFGDTPAN